MNQASDSPRFCPPCGSMLPPGELACPKCGREGAAVSSRVAGFARSVARSQRVLATFWFVVCWGAAGLGLILAWQQNARIVGYHPVAATVLSSQVAREETRDSEGHWTTSHLPRIEYRYRVGGQTYSNDTVFATIMSGASAGTVVDRFPVGEGATAYYDPRDPQQAFLWRRASFYPYLVIWAPLALALMGCLVFGSTRQPGEPGEGPLFRPWVKGMAAAALLIGLGSAGHYFWLAASGK